MSGKEKYMGMLVPKAEATKKLLLGLGAGGVGGFAAGRMSKKASENKYLEKIARSIGVIGKSLIRTKLAPAMAKMPVSRAANIEAISRASAGSKVAPRVFSTPEYAQHSVAMANLGKKLAPGMNASEANRIMAVAARARKMNVIKSAA